MEPAHLAEIDAAGIVQRRITTADPGGWPLAIPCPPDVQYLWRYDAVALTWSDTPEAQAYRAAQAAADATEQTRRRAVDRGDAILRHVRHAYAADGDSMDEVLARLLYELIGRIAAGNRSPAMVTYLARIDAARAAVQAAIAARRA